jgi:hypothetical protein
MSGTASRDLRNQAEYKRNRKRLLADSPTCYVCNVNQATEADHVLEADAGGTNDISNLAPICKPCNARKGQRYRMLKERQAAGNLVVAPSTTQSVFSDDRQMPPHLPNRIFHKGLSELAPLGHARPRLETTTQSDAETFAGDIGDFARNVLGVELMPWQLRAAAGMTQHVDGEWLVRQSMVSVARQNGKTTLMAAVIGWWLCTQGAARGQPQTVVSSAHKLDLATALFKYLAPILEAKAGARPSWSYGRMSLDMPDGSTWLVRAATPQAGHGYSIDLCVVDECWAVSEAAVDEGLLPAQRARRNPLLAMFSTAGTQDSHLMLRWREQGLRQIDAGDVGPLYFASWEPPSNLDPMTPEAWAYANPALGITLEPRTIQAEAKAPNRSAFLRGSVNLFTASANGWLEQGLWAAGETAGDMPAGGVLAVEASTDESRFMAVRAVKTGDKTMVGVAFNVDTQAEMWRIIGDMMKDTPTLRLAIPPSLEIHCPPALERRRVIVGYRELLKWTLTVRSMIVEGKITHRGEASLGEHVERAVMVKHNGSVSLSSTRSPGDITLARCMVWAAALESKPNQGGKPMLAVAR